MSARSFLFVPGDRPEMLERAGGRGADAVIADLEDAVAPSAKGGAREVVAVWAASPAPVRPERWVRVNPVPVGTEDVAAVFGPGLAGFVVPKVRSVDELEMVDPAVAEAEARHGIDPGNTRVIPVIETAAAIAGLAAIASGPGVLRLMVGEMDLGADARRAGAGGRRGGGPLGASHLAGADRDTG